MTFDKVWLLNYERYNGFNVPETARKVYLLNRGNRNDGLPSNVKIIKGDINNEQEIAVTIAK